MGNRENGIGLGTITVSDLYAHCDKNGTYRKCVYVQLLQCILTFLYLNVYNTYYYYIGVEYVDRCLWKCCRIIVTSANWLKVLC